MVVPEKAEKEAGFQMWIQKLRNIADNSGARIVFYAPENTMQYLRPTRGKRSAKAEYVVSNPWDDLTALTYETKRDDCLWVVMSRRERVSYHPAMSKLPQSRCARQIPLFVAARHLPPAGGSRPLGWGLWQYGKVSG